MKQNTPPATAIPASFLHHDAVAAYQPDLISVIIPTYNRAGLILEALGSVAQQTYRNFEILLIDDGSTDGTQAAVGQWMQTENAIPVQVIHQANGGPAAARNTGLRASSGGYIFFLDSDDLIFPEALGILLDKLLASQAPYALAHIHNSDISGNILSADISGISKQSQKNIFRSRWMTHSALYRRSALERSGLFNETLRGGEDTEFQWRIVATNGAGCLTNDYIGLRRQHDQGHLSVNRSDRTAFSQSIEALFAFADWLERTDGPSQRVSTATLASILGLGIRSGKLGLFDLKDRAFALPARLSRKDLLLYKASRILGLPNNIGYFNALHAGFKGVKAIWTVGKLTRARFGSARDQRAHRITAETLKASRPDAPSSDGAKSR